MKTRNVLAAVGALALSITLAGPASAAALHGYCDGTGGGACIDNGTNTPLGDSSQFGFWLSSANTGVTGTLSLEVLLPNNYSFTGSFGINGINGFPSGTATEVGSGWTSGDLATYLGISASPTNPIGAFLPTTNALGAPATGYDVFQFTHSGVTLSSSTATYQFDAISGLGAYTGAYIVAFFNTGVGTACDECATANSGALLVDGRTPPPSVPEPGTLALFATALAGLGVFGRRFRRKA